MMTINLFLCTLRVFARDDHHLAPCISETRQKVVHDVLAHWPRNGSHLLPDGFLVVSDGPGLP